MKTQFQFPESRVVMRARLKGGLTYVGRIGLISGAEGWTPAGGRSAAAQNTRGGQTHNQGLASTLLASHKTAALYFGFLMSLIVAHAISNSRIMNLHYITIITILQFLLQYLKAPGVGTVACTAAAHLGSARLTLARTRRPERPLQFSCVCSRVSFLCDFIQ